VIEDYGGDEAPRVEIPPSRASSDQMTTASRPKMPANVFA
jgi:hypothetical protein